MKEKLLTIIVPSYNVEKYLPECIPPYVIPVCDNRLEVIIVDDGSTDKTREIAENFHKQYPEVIRVVSKQNGGHGSTINSGLRRACGKYFKVIDGDDYVDNGELIRFLDLLQKSDEDVITNDKINFIDGTDKQEKLCFAPIKYNVSLSFESMSREWNYSMHRIAIKTDILRENMPSLDEKCFYVDQEFIFYSLPFVRSLKASDTTLYYYRLGNASQSVSISNMFKRRENLFRVLNSLLDFYPTILRQKIYKNVKDYIDYYIGQQINHYARIVLKCKDVSPTDVKSVLSIYDRVQKECVGIYNNLPKNKGVVLARVFGPVMYSTFAKIVL